VDLSDAELHTLNRCAPLQDLAVGQVLELAPFLRDHHRLAGEHLWWAGDPASDLWFLLTGQLHTVYADEVGEEVVTQLILAGQSFGEPALFLEHGERVVSVIALADCRVLSLPKEPLLRFLERHPPALRRMLEALSRMAVSQSVLFGQLVFHDIRGRVAYQLLKLADEYGIRTAAGVRLPVKLSQTTLAGLVGSTRESVNRALSALAAEGAVTRSGGAFVILDEVALRRSLVRE
jgi:CRP-like cAMP-binding protein